MPGVTTPAGWSRQQCPTTLALSLYVAFKDLSMTYFINPLQKFARQLLLAIPYMHSFKVHTMQFHILTD